VEEVVPGLGITEVIGYASVVRVKGYLPDSVARFGIQLEHRVVGYITLSSHRLGWSSCIKIPLWCMLDASCSGRGVRGRRLWLMVRPSFAK
jgi:hypothetical protein